MNFFRKNDNKPTLSAHTEQENTQPSSTKETTEAHENMAQEPHLSKVELESLIKEEAKRLRVTEHLLSAPHLQRIQDALRLNETKFANVEENLMHTREQKERLRRFKQLQGEMEQLRKHLFETNKLVASMLTDKRELERFETFENVQGLFQRLQTLERQRRDEKQRESVLAGEVEQSQHRMEDELKRLNQCMDETDESEKLLALAQHAIGNAAMLEGSNSALAYMGQKASELSSQLNSRCNAMEKELQEQDATIEQLTAEIEKKRTRLQSTEAHQRMAKHSELIVDQLTRLHKLMNKVEQAETQLKDAEQRQRSENDLLGRVFSDYQQLEAQIKTTTDELHVHRQSILGQNSYQLQERAMKLKSRRQMLLSAKALWSRIQTLYTLIEEKQQQVNSLRLHLDHVSENVRQLDNELGLLRRSAKEKEYTFTLSKSQNVIQLRSDLKEGVSCTVCGAKHHPYHSDTMLEQNKLISDLKTEAEMLQTELTNKERALQEARIDQERTAIQKKGYEQELVTLRALQNEAVREWSMYAELDSSFITCDSTTNAEARMAMLRQLIENIEADVQKAQDELNNYNFHQSRINELTETIGRQEQKRNDLTIRMNEINTSCQVLAREVDWISSRRQDLTGAYGRLFEKVDKAITLPDWFNTWKRGHESTLMRIQEISTERTQLTAKVQEEEQLLAEIQAVHEQTQLRFNELKQQQQITQNHLVDAQNLTDENNKELERLLQGMNSKLYHEKMTNQWQADRKKMEEQRDVVDTAKEAYLQAKGRQEELRQTATKTDAMANQERSSLDIWIRQYNASHSPVQYVELEQFFEEEKDWTLIREQIRKADLDARLTEAKLDYLKSEMVALQAEGNIPDGDATEALLTMAKQEEVLEKRRHEVMLLIATNTLTLQAHEKAEAQITSDKMKEL